MSELEKSLKSKISIERKHVALCEMNQCTRGSGVPLIIALEDSEGIANQKAEAHRNSHRDHEKRVNGVLDKHRTAQGSDEEGAAAEVHGR